MKRSYAPTYVCGVAKLKEEFEDKANLKYLSFLINTYTVFYVSIASGNPKLMNNVFEEIKIPLLPKQEQDQIAVKIVAIERKIEALKSMLRPSQVIINEAFAKFFGCDKNLCYAFGKGMTART